VTNLRISVLLCLSTAIACSSSSGSPTTPPTDAANETAAETSVVPETGGEETGAPATGDQACAATEDLLTCQQCCGDLHQAAFAAVAATVRTCVCREGVCATECKESLCAAPPKEVPNTPEGQACVTCANAKQQEVCTADLQACAQGDCAPYVACFDTAGCARKPRPAGG
jgi:hypothetical protein